ncbi:MAG TPA: BlaI/MecI/CopY family transcriptional regulator [Candidatus Acidoferrales bacterium]|nr:BlaI/MecI/CopY family transcriptional regulator [Candidatus Acidoferrales bacterium]
MSHTAARMALDSNGLAKEPKAAAKPRSVLELAPLELACMNALWTLGEASVREIHASLSVTRPRAYTTIMTIMDRLARKGIVERQRAGRAWRYRPNLTAEDARSHAIAQVVEGFFGGSSAALVERLRGHKAIPSIARDLTPRAQEVVVKRPATETESDRVAAPRTEVPVRQSRMDETLL